MRAFAPCRLTSAGASQSESSAAVAIVGLVLKLTIYKSAPQVSASIEPGGASLFVGWQR